MADDVLGVKQVNIPVALEIWGESCTRTVDFVFVRVNQAGIRVPVDCVGYPKQSVLCKKIIMIEKRNPISGSQFQAGVGCRSDMPVLLTESELDSGIVLGVTLQNGANAFIRGCVIRNAKLQCG